MPISKIPIVHKFGIISHSQRLELQERLLKQSYLQSLETQRGPTSARNPLEVTEEFVQQYNNATSLDDKEKYETIAHKMLERAKRRAGVNDGGSGRHVNLPMAWTELVQIAQCKGKIQEECLDVLITSLDQSPLEKYHIPALFFLAETMLYWLRTDAIHQPYLRTGEIKLLKMGQLTFTRLFYHHMSGQLQGENEFKNRLFTYLDGLQECQEAYNPYPNALLSLRFIITVGKIIMADAQVEPGEIKEGDNVSKQTSLSKPSAVSRPISNGTEETRKEERIEALHSSHSGALSSCVHDLSPTLWHALDVWRCTNQLGGGLIQALRALAQCGMGIQSENWVDSMIAMQILSEASKTNLTALRVLHNLARGIQPREEISSPPVSSSSGSSEEYSLSSTDSDKGHESRASVVSSKPHLSDIYERSEEADSEKKYCFSENGQIEDSDNINIYYVTSKNGQTERPKPVLKEGSGNKLGEGREVSFNEDVFATDRKPIEGSGQKRETAQDSIKSGQSSGDPVPGTGWRATAGTDLPSGRASDASSVQTYTNAPATDTPGINGWHWEVAITYTYVLADICLYATTANIQKLALMGGNKEIVGQSPRISKPLPLPSAGLFDLAFFHAVKEKFDGSSSDWSWRIRYGAVQSLVKICHFLTGNKGREGMRTAAWNILLKAQSTEKDDRVLEALKVGQVHTELDKIISKTIPSHTPTITVASMIAAGLGSIFLPPLPPPVEVVPQPRREMGVPKIRISQPTQEKTKSLRTSLRDEITLATALYEPPVDFKKRTSYDLHRIVEDQWRKELQKQIEEEEEKRQRELLEKQKQLEKKQQDVAEKKAQKMARAFQKESDSSD